MEEIKIRKQIGYLKQSCPETCKEAIDVLEKVLAVGAMMPVKDTTVQTNEVSTLLQDARNTTIDQCTLAITGALLSEEEIESIIEDFCEDNGGCGVAINPEKCATAIHSAQMEKLGGE